ncbi:DUF6223 family protein [Streptomyces sp. NPDC014779]|uniref:DUF6223 family protein n=1 Tax=unclassified Streptomyces TaxID=2593676 RepID=UPI0033FC6BCF
MTTAPTALAAVSAYTLSPGRIGSSAAAVIGLLAAVTAWRALSGRPGRLGRLGGAPALGAGLFAMALGALVAATADGGLGTGNGLGGAYVALLVGALATVLAARVLRRARRTGGAG